MVRTMLLIHAVYLLSLLIQTPLPTLFNALPYVEFIVGLVMEFIVGFIVGFVGVFIERFAVRFIVGIGILSIVGLIVELSFLLIFARPHAPARPPAMAIGHQVALECD